MGNHQEKSLKGVTTLRLVVLVGPRPSGVYFANRLNETGQLVGVFQEVRHPPSFKEKLKKNMKRPKALIRKVLNKLMGIGEYYKLGMQTQREYFFENKPIEFSNEAVVRVVSNINDIETVKAIRSLKPDIIAVLGTSVIKRPIMEISKYILNIHTGLSPEYRGCDNVWWPLYNNEPDMVGVTVQFLSRKIDAGDIIYKEQIPVFPGKTPDYLLCRCIDRGIDLMIKAIEDIKNSTITSQPQDLSKGMYYKGMSVWEKRSTLKKLGIGKK